MMAMGFIQAAGKALSKTALILDDIPVAAANLIEVEVKNPGAPLENLPTPHKGRPMSEGEFYLKAAGASLVPKAAVALALGGAAAALSFAGGAAVLTYGLVPLAFWLCGKSAEKDDDGGEDDNKKEGRLWTDGMMNVFPGAKKFLGRLPAKHRRILGRTIQMDVALEMEMMTLAAVALGASGLAMAGAAGIAATVGLVPVVALAATGIVWGTAYGVRQLRNLIGKNQKKIDAGQRQETRFDRALKFIDKKIDPTFSLVGKLALMSIGGALIISHGLIPLVPLALPHLSAAAPAVQSAVHLFNALPDMAQLAIATPVGYGLGKFVYNPIIAPLLRAPGLIAKKLSGGKKQKPAAAKESFKPPQPATGPLKPVVPPSGTLKSAFEEGKGAHPAANDTRPPEAGRGAFKYG